MASRSDLPPVAELLAQGPSFRFVDSVVHWTDRSIAARRAISRDDPIFKDHFATMPIYPGVLLVEMMAQAASLIPRIAAHDGSGIKGPPGAIGKIKNVSFLSPVRPGDILDIFVERGVSFGKLSEFHCRIARDDEILARGTLVLSDPSAS